MSCDDIAAMKRPLKVAQIPQVFLYFISTHELVENHVTNLRTKTSPLFPKNSLSFLSPNFSLYPKLPPPHNFNCSLPHNLIPIFPSSTTAPPQTPQEQRVTDLLWSDPSDSDHVKGVTTNETRDPDGTGRIVKFGPDRVISFLEANPPLSMIIRAHECVMDGFERFAGGKLITLFSATDYCGHHKNAGALLFIRRDLTVVPKLIYPTTDRTSGSTPGPEHRGGDSWDPKVTMMRPPTPPRPVPRARRQNEPGGDW